MDTERPRIEVGPDALDLAIQAALNIDPSPEFLARVRARVAGEPPARRWTVTIVPVTAAAMLAILVLLAVNTSRRPRSIPDAVQPTTAPRGAVVTGSAASTVTLQAAPAVPSAPQVRRLAPEPTRRAAAAPRLSNEARGLQLLVDTINRGSVIVVADDIQSSGRGPTEIRELEITTLTIPSIHVEPIAPVVR